MIVCLCHPFNDKKVRDHLQSRGCSARVAEVYGACADGNKPQCCSCLETLKDMVKAHNKTVVA